MSEYIIDMGDSSYKSSSGLLCADVSQLREEIVRCRDCKHYTDGEVEYRHYCNEWCGQVKPDDFCSWGWKDDFVTCKCGEDIERHDRIQICPSCGRVVYA